MQPPSEWDYLIVTASNALQGRAYEREVRLRQELGLLDGARRVLVLPDPQGKRIGSGGSTVLALLAVAGCELNEADAPAPTDAAAWERVLRGRRVLIVHGGGESRRLPAYAAAGKVFVPLPGAGGGAIPPTLFDRQLPVYLALWPAPGAGQVVVVAGDVLLRFGPPDLRTAPEGITGLGCAAAPERAARHGVFLADAAGRVRRYLQKPSPEHQARAGALDERGRAVLDVGVLIWTASAAAKLIALAAPRRDDAGRFAWSGAVADAIESHGLDIYREVCCALGSETQPGDYVEAVRAAGSTWDERLLHRLFSNLHDVPFAVHVLSECEFLHFGTTRHLISSGRAVAEQDADNARSAACLSVGNDLDERARLVGADAWIEGCRIRADLTLGGRNVVVGADVDEPLSLPPGACLDVTPGRSRSGAEVWFVKCYGVDDTFKPAGRDAALCGRPLEQWLADLGAVPGEVWDEQTPPGQRTAWNARLFPAVPGPADAARWLWLYDPASGDADRKAEWAAADRYSLAEISRLADRQAFHERRRRIRAAQVRAELPRWVGPEGALSARELAWLLADTSDRTAWAAELLDAARAMRQADARGSASRAFAFSRLIHTTASALGELAGDEAAGLADVLLGLQAALGKETARWLDSLGLAVGGATVGRWCRAAREAAFHHLSRRIVASGARAPEAPRSALRPDEIVWGRAPARLDVGGGWTDTPPYSLERGGCVVNAAVDLNGQPPIHCYARVIDEPVIRISSIDLARRVEIRDADRLLDFRSPTAEFSLAKAALAMSGFAPQGAEPLGDVLDRFGGGIELTTLAAIPKGSGLGTSSIVGAVILAVVNRVLGRSLTQAELFHGVLQLEQALTTGGGWQDQIGGAVRGAKLITTKPGLVAKARIRPLPPDVLDPQANGGVTLLYYTGITRLARDILQQVVGRYLDRDRRTVRTLAAIRALAPHVAEAMEHKDVRAFGEGVAAAWELNKRLDPNSTNEEIDSLLRRVRPRVYGGKLLGAGGGGFLLLVCKSPDAAAAVRAMLEAEPPNERARFFDFAVSVEGLTVTVC